MATVTTSTAGPSLTRSGRCVGRNNDTSLTALCCVIDGISGTNAYAFYAVSPYSSWTKHTGGQGLLTSDTVPAIDIDGVQATSPTGNACVASCNGSDSYHWASPYASHAYGDITDENSGNDYFCSNQGGNTDAVVLPNHHCWMVGPDRDTATYPQDPYTTATGHSPVVCGLSLTPTGALTGSGGNTLVASLTESSPQFVCPKVAWNKTSSYTVVVAYNDGAGNLRWLSFADGTSAPGSPPTNALVSTGSVVKDSQLNITTDTNGNTHLVAANANGIQYWYLAAGGASWNGPYSISGSTNDDQPTIACVMAATPFVVVAYRHYTGTTNKYNLLTASATIVTSGAPTFGADATVYSDSGTNNAAYPAMERISPDATTLLVTFMTATSTPWTVNAALITPTGQAAGPIGTPYPMGTNSSTGAISSLVITTSTAGTTLGDGIFVTGSLIGAVSGPSGIGVTDSAGNTYQVLITSNTGVRTGFLAYATSTTALTTSSTITVSWTNTTADAAVAANGCTMGAGTITADQTQTASGTNGSGTTGTTGTTTVAAELALAFFAWDAITPSFSADTYTLLQEVDASVASIRTLYKILAATGTQNATETATGTVTGYQAGIATFYGATTQFPAGYANYTIMPTYEIPARNTA